MDSIDAIALCPPEVIEKLRGTYTRISFGDHIVFATKNLCSCAWYYVIKTEIPSVYINRGSLEYLFDVLDVLLW